MNDIIEKLLSDRFQGKVRLNAAETIRSGGRSNVTRFGVLEGPQNAPESVIVKQAVAVGNEVYNPDVPDGPAWRLFNEWAGLQFLTESSGGVSPTPKFFAGDREHALIVMEDLGAGKRLDNALLGNNPDVAEELLVALASTLGRMHSLTICKHGEYERYRNSLGPSESEPPDDGGQRLTSILHTLCERIGVKPATGIEEDLRTVTKSLVEPGAFHAYLHRDPCPDNCLITDDGFKLIDFEFGAFGHALLDGIYGRIHFPTCWCVNRLPERIPPRMEAAYRAELIKGCPDAADDERFYKSVVEVCAATLINSHRWIELQQEDRQWGISTMRQRALLRFDIFWKMSGEYGHLKSVGETARVIVDKLRAEWSAETDEMPYYPAFRAR